MTKPGWLGLCTHTHTHTFLLRSLPQKIHLGHPYSLAILVFVPIQLSTFPSIKHGSPFKTSPHQSFDLASFCHTPSKGFFFPPVSQRNTEAVWKELARTVSLSLTAGWSWLGLTYSPKSKEPPPWRHISILCLICPLLHSQISWKQCLQSSVSLSLPPTHFLPHSIGFFPPLYSTDTVTTDLHIFKASGQLGSSSYN